MCTYSLSHLTNGALLRDLAALVARDRTTTAALLAHLAEFDARRLYLPAAYSSMYAYCVGELRLSEDTACKRVRAARAARQFPAIFAAVAEGRLHVSAVVMLAPHLTPENAEELLAAVARKSKAEVELLLAGRFPRPDVPALVEPLPPSPVSEPGELSQGTPELSAPGRIKSSAPRPKVAPLAPERYALQLTMSQSTHDKLRHAQALLGHQIPSGDVAQVLDRALDALIHQLERRKFAATTKARDGQRRSTGATRHVPAHIRRAVWARDGGQCTFVGEAGRRCAARTRLEFDHVDEVARGGQATTRGIRLRCRAHNQYTAGITFGTGFMDAKREAARHRAAQANAAALARAAAQARAGAAAAPDPDRDVTPWLRRLGFRADEVRRAAAHCESIPEATLEERVRFALASMAVRGVRRDASGPRAMA